MSGRGRGRGRGPFINRPLFGAKLEDSLPPTGQPPPLYPPLKYKPVPLPSGKRISYLLNLKQEIRSAIKESAYYIPPVSLKKDIERYTDRYQQIQAPDEIEWDKNMFPKELFTVPAKKKKKKKKVVKKAPKAEVIVEKLKELEAKEETEEVEDEEEEQEIENEEELDELEEETDYAQNYFDNGESYLDDEDDNFDEGYE